VPAPGPGDWQLQLDEQFDGSTVDASRWATCYWWAERTCTNAGNDELELYTPQNVAVAAGNLRLEARREQATDEHGTGTYDYTSGMISGRGPTGTRLQFQYGYFEMRARLPVGTGMWSAFWLLPSTQESLPEIDVFEVVGEAPHRVVQSLHVGTEADRERRHRDVDTTDLTTGWHRFGLRWEADRLAWYVDGTETFVIDDADLIPHEPMYLIANLAVGGTFTETPDAQTPFPSRMDVDYIRVWQQP
jgi:beta-glucanase (GH16 family)